MNPRLPAPECSRGFTLVELIIVIVLTGIVAVMASNMIGQQMQGYVDMSRRAALVTKADIALQHIARDLSNAAPYSIRINGGTALEWVPVIDWGRYRKLPDTDQSAVLDFSKPDDLFEVLVASTMPSVPANARILIGNTDAMGVDGINVYGDTSTGTLVPAGSNVITPTTVAVAASGNDITLSPAFQFSLASVASRFYVVSSAASYICSGGAIHRYSDYQIQKSQPVSEAGSPLSGAVSALLLDGVSACQFDYSALDAERGQVVIRLQLQDGGESINATRIINIENRP